MDTRPPRKFVRFFFLSFVLFCLFLPLWRIMSPLYARILLAVAHPLLPRLTVTGSEQKVAFFTHTKGTSVYLVDPRGVTEENADQAPAVSFNTRQVHLNTPLLVALFFATPGMWRGRYWKQFAIALAVLFLWHATYVSFVLYRLAEQIASVPTPAPGQVIRLRTNLPYEAFFSLFIPQLLPFLLWMGLVHLRQTAPPKESSVSMVVVGRNDPCPCGSGRKYKHCCGASQGAPA